MEPSLVIRTRQRLGEPWRIMHRPRRRLRKEANLAMKAALAGRRDKKVMMTSVEETMRWSPPTTVTVG